MNTPSRTNNEGEPVMSEELADIAKKRGIKYFLVSFIDLFGVLRSKLVPAGRIHDIQRDGALERKIPTRWSVGQLGYNG